VTHRGSNQYGAGPDPTRTLRDAAIAYGVALGADGDGAETRARRRQAWDRLRRAAIRYREAPARTVGRPLGVADCAPRERSRG
jgi:hypothetical protein